MATWNDIFVQEVTATPTDTDSVNLAFPGGATASIGNKLLLIVSVASFMSLDTAALVADGWTQDADMGSGLKGYIFSRRVVSEGVTGVTVGFSGVNRPVLRLIELSGVSDLKTAYAGGGITAGPITNSSDSETLYIGVVRAGINGGEPTFDIWSDSFSGLGTLRSATGAPWDFGMRTVMAVSQRIVAGSGTYQSTPTLGGTGDPAYLDGTGALVSYRIGAESPVVSAGDNVTIPRSSTLNRLAIEDANGGTIASRSWTIESGPVQVGATLSTSASLVWTPVVEGEYVLKYNATNEAGSGEIFVTVTVQAPIIVAGSSSPVVTGVPPGKWRARIKASGPGGSSSFSSWSNDFTVYSGGINLPQLDWWGGPSYYEQFPVASAAGWTDPSFFPISVFFGKPSHTSALMSIGINTLMGAEHDGSTMASITSQGMHVIAQGEWTPTEVNNDPLVVGWHASDECDMGYSGCTPDWENDNGEYGRLAIQQQYVDTFRDLDDGRFVQANFGNGVLGTHWAPNTMPDHVALMDLTCVDKYAYTSPHVQDLFRDSPYWPVGKDPASAGAYGWQHDRMASFASPAGSKSNWIFIESAMPYLTEPGATSIQLEQIEGAVWNSIIHGAGGIAYFQHNNDGVNGNYSLVDGEQARKDKVAQVNAQVTSLAPVINTQSYQWTFGPDLETALKAYDGDAYIFAMTSGGSGLRTFTLPSDIPTDSTIEVVDESRTITATGNIFTDTFQAEHTHHIYKISLGG